MNKPKVSVVLPVYNVGAYLNECLVSICCQSLSDIEIICVNDGSTDNSADILAEFAERDSRVKVIYQENAGAGAARNLGLTMACGEYISFLDSDDFFEPTMLEVAYNKAKKYAADMVIFRSDNFIDRTQSFEPVSWTLNTKKFPDKDCFASKEIDINIFRSMVGWAWDKLFSRSFIYKYDIKFQEIQIYNDLCFVFTALLLADRIVISEQVLAHHRKRGGGSLSDSKGRAWWCVYDALTGLCINLKKNELYIYYNRDFTNYALYLCLYTLNSLTGSAYAKAYEQARNVWLVNLEVFGYPKEFYYSPTDYKQMCHIMATSTFDELANKLEEKEQEIARFKKKLEIDNIVSLEQYNDLRNSFSFRIGRFITYIPRKVRGGIRCYREHGVGYTIRRMKEKFVGLFGGSKQ